MDGESDSQRTKKRRIDDAAKSAFLESMRAGLHRNDAARAAGFNHRAFYRVRERDPVFHQAWLWASELSAADDRAAVRPAAVPGEEAIEPNNNRRLQRRRVRHRRFDAQRMRIFLDRLAGTADVREAADVAGVSYSTVFEHFRKDAEFAAAWHEALAVAYAALEAEVLRQRLEAQRALRDGLCPTGEMTREFERVMQLLARYERRGGGVGLRAARPGHERRWTFDEAIAELDRRLRALGARSGVAAGEDPPLQLPPPGPDPSAQDPSP